MMLVRMGSGISKPLVPKGDGLGQIGSCGLLGLEASEELVDVSQHPDEHLEEMSPSRAMSRDRDEDLDDLPEEPPREDPAREEAELPPPAPAPATTLTPPGRRTPTLWDGVSLGRGGENAEVAPPDLKGGDALTQPSGCCTEPQTSAHFLPAVPICRCAGVVSASTGPRVAAAIGGASKSHCRCTRRGPTPQ